MSETKQEVTLENWKEYLANYCQVGIQNINLKKPRYILDQTLTEDFIQQLLDMKEKEIEELKDRIDELEEDILVAHEDFVCPHHRDTGGYESCCECTGPRPCDEYLRNLNH